MVHFYFALWCISGLHLTIGINRKRVIKKELLKMVFLKFFGNSTNIPFKIIGVMNLKFYFILFLLA